MLLFVSLQDSGFIPKLIKQVRCVNVGHNWGSGVVIDSRKGLILTCSHVLHDVKFSGGMTTTLMVSCDSCTCLYSNVKPLKCIKLYLTKYSEKESNV